MLFFLENGVFFVTHTYASIIKAKFVFYCNKNKQNWSKMAKVKNILRTFGAHFGKNLRTLRLSHFSNVLIKKMSVLHEHLGAVVLHEHLGAVL